ncbi:MAG: hypothetical protein GY719_23295 [bacterium]|nr:hypothetical protein [bacterium]
MKRRLLSLSLVAFLGLSFVGPPPMSAAAIPVFDYSNLIQSILDYLKRLFEIAQRAIMIANQIQELDYWFYTVLKLEEIPYREEVLEFLEVQAELLKQFDSLQGQYQALSHSLENVTYEFDITFPGWRAFSEMAAGASLQVQSEAGTYHFGAPLEYARYQSARTLQAVRQSLAAMAEDQADLLASQMHLQQLKEQVPLAEGQQQTLELQTSLAALSAEQLVALRQSQEALAMTAGTLGAHRLNSDMQLLASQSRAAEELAEALLGEFGELVPEHTGESGIDPFPWWVQTF